MPKTVLYLSLTLAFMFMAASACGDVLVTYDFESASGTAPALGTPGSSAPAGVGFSSLQRHGLTANDFAFRTSAPGGGNWLGFGARRLGKTGYLEFAVTPGNAPISLDSISLDAWARNSLGGTAAAHYRIELNNTPVGTITGPAAPGSSTRSSSLSLDLTSLPSQSDPMVFRIYTDQGGSGAGSFGQRGVAIDNLVLSGSVTAVPEPSSVALMTLIGIGTVARSRRQLAKELREDTAA